MKRHHFHQELGELTITILKMAALTQQSLEDATRAFRERNDDLARKVVDGDAVINEQELEIDKQSLRLLALEQPMARDLRMILGIMRTSNELERIADQSVNIAERTIFLCQHPPLDPIPALEQLIETSKGMLKMAIGSLRDLDADAARQVCQLDDQADEYTVQVLRELIELMAMDAPVIEKRRLKMRRSIQTIIISRCLERIGDLSTNIGEHVTFIVEGVNIKHQKLTGESPKQIP